MANKPKEIIKNNLLEIREGLGYTQKEMGELLDVSERMICNYETGEANLPIDKAIRLSKEFNYSLDWIYCNSEKQDKNNHSGFDISQTDKFIVDLREFITFSNNMLHIGVKDSYWKYIRDVNSISSAQKPEREKKLEKARLDGAYKIDTNKDVVWRVSIPKGDIMSYITIDSNFIPYVDNDDYIGIEPTSEQKAEAEEFLKSLF